MDRIFKIKHSEEITAGIIKEALSDWFRVRGFSKAEVEEISPLTQSEWCKRPIKLPQKIEPLYKYTGLFRPIVEKINEIVAHINKE